MQSRQMDQDSQSGNSLPIIPPKGEFIIEAGWVLFGSDKDQFLLLREASVLVRGDKIERVTQVFISHDLSVVRHISHKIAIMYLGHIIEITKSAELYANPIHPYTKALLSAVPIPDPFMEDVRQRIVLSGDVPSPVHSPPGCPFHPRCFLATSDCSRGVPPLRDLGNGHKVACVNNM